LSSIYQQYTDEELFKLYQKEGNNDVLGSLLQRYTVLLLGVCVKYLKDTNLAKDAVQQVFFKVITDVDRFEITFFKAWIYKVTTNYCLMQLRKKNNYFNTDTELLKIGKDETVENELKQEQEEQLNKMHKALENLNTQQALCVKLFYLQKQSYQQISISTGFDVLQVRSYIQNGKRNLKILLQTKDI
jgi:RNA polymerase sigma factor (sigma-70 family)